MSRATSERAALWTACWIAVLSVALCSGCDDGNLAALPDCDALFDGCDAGAGTSDPCWQDSDCEPFQECVLPELVELTDASTPPLRDAGMDASAPMPDAAASGDAEAPSSDGGLGDFTAEPSELDDEVDVTVGRCECRSDRCGDRRSCTEDGPEGVCVSVECRRDSDCEGSGFECHAQSCWDMAGRCDAPEDCRVSSTIRARFEPLCLGSRCQLQTDGAHRTIPNLNVPKPVHSQPSPLGSVETRAPSSWDVLLLPSELSIEWTQPAAGGWSLLVVVNRPATTVEDIRRGARWAAFVPDSACKKGWCTATWHDGLQSVDETLQALAPEGAEAVSADSEFVPSTYYVLALHMREQDIVATSAYLPVRIGSRWPASGDSCDQGADPLEACSSPRVPMTCAKQRCRVLCASHTDCQTYVRSGALCGPPDAQDVRVCPL